MMLTSSASSSSTTDAALGVPGSDGMLSSSLGMSSAVTYDVASETGFSSVTSEPGDGAVTYSESEGTVSIEWYDETDEAALGVA
jgi:hypothetical protein